jgi:hypothetical protein
MSERNRFLVTVDSARGVPVKVERIGEAGELTEVDLQGFVRSLVSSSPASPSQQIVINIYGGTAQGAEVVEQARPAKNLVYDDEPGPYLNKPKKEEEKKE